MGKVRAKQYYSDDHDRSRNMGVLLHGDGSFSGQGVVYETLDMSALQDYTVGGVIHIVVNNQVSSSNSAFCDVSCISDRKERTSLWPGWYGLEVCLHAGSEALAALRGAPAAQARSTKGQQMSYTGARSLIWLA